MPKHISGFDYLRALGAILVVLWHSQGLSFLGEINSSLNSFVSIFYYNICLLAVPIFFSISLCLFYRKQLDQSPVLAQNSFPKNRLIGLIRLYAIWLFVGIAFNLFRSEGSYLLSLSHIENLVNIIVRGSRPELFFLFSLIVISSLSFFNSKYLLGRENSLKIQLLLTLISSLGLMVLSYHTLATHQTAFSAFWNPVCFLPYIFSAAILARIDEHTASGYLDKRKFQFILILLAVFLLLSWLEWQIFHVPNAFDGYLLPPYARASLVVGSFLICYCGIVAKTKPRGLVLVLSQESLGIYLLHNYALFMMELIVDRVDVIPLLVMIITHPMAKVILAITLSVLISKALKRYEFGRMMLNTRSS
ncbi:MAG: acyltransferase [Pseudanabaena sp. ELA607]